MSASRSAAHCFDGGRGVGVAVVLDDDDQRAALHRGEVDALVERAGGGGAVAHVHQPDARLLPHLERERDAGHDRHHVAQVRDLADEVPVLEVAEMDVELAAARGRIALGHVLPQHLERGGALDQHGAQVPDERREHVLAAEGVGGADGAGLLPQRAEQPAHDLGLPVQVDQPLLERPGQAHPIVEFEELVPRQPGPGGRIGGESAGDGHAGPG